MYNRRGRRRVWFGFYGGRYLGCFFYPVTALVAGLMITMARVPAWSNWVFFGMSVLLIVACVYVTRRYCS